MTITDPWLRATTAAAFVAVDPVGLGGLAVRADAGPVRQALLNVLRSLLPPETPWRKLPNHAGDARVLGGLDLAATLSAGRPVAERGLLAEADGGLVIIPMAERVAPGLAARLAAVLDGREVAIERDGLTRRFPASIGLVLLDESLPGEDGPALTLTDRVGMLVQLGGVRMADTGTAPFTQDDVAAARAALHRVTAGDDIAAALVETAAMLGIPSFRAVLLTLRAARVSAALDGRDTVTSDDAELAAGLVLAPRATRIPTDEAPDEQPEEPPPEPPDAEPSDTKEDDIDKPLADSVVEAAAAAIPPDLLAALRLGGARVRSRSDGKAGADKVTMSRGRPLPSRRGDPRTGARLDLVETLRTAAPWQALRRPPGAARVEVRKDDFRVRRFRDRARTTTIFAVDASGSQALHRLAEAKGAVETLLAECYVRRDQVALIAFRDRGAQMLLPPTRSLARAKRCLSSLPGGGGTPLALGLDAAAMLADAVRRKGDSVVLVVLTDGQANITRAGTGGRAEAFEQALASARAIAAAFLPAIVIDTSPRPQAKAERLAADMHARYVALPVADARAVGQAVRLLSASA